MVSEPCPKLSRADRLVNPQISNKELQKKSNMVSEPCPKLSRANKLVTPQISNKGLQKKMIQAYSKAVKND